ncbi:hypothetical protein ACQEU3_38925 [Spirillospora sp. CA-253888]
MVEFNADGEELAEGGVQDWLAEIAPGLERHGLTLDMRVLADPYQAEGDDYVLEINGHRCPIWTEREMGRRDLWGVATARPVTVINTLLAVSGTPVRAYLLHEGGNEGMLLLLPPGVPAAMRASGLFQERDVPALPTREG